MAIESITSGLFTPPSDMISSRSESMDRADFLQMLTAQLKAQDPLNPLDGQDFASQLATFTSLQELQNINSTLDSSLEANLLLAHTFNNTMATSLIGKSVRAQADTVAVTKTGTGTLTYDLDSAATEITIEIKDNNGKVVRTMNLNAQEAGGHSVEWDGLDSDGKHVAAGNYTFSITATGADGNSVGVTTVLEGTVSEVRYQNGNVFLIVNGHEVLLSQVLSLSEPEPAKKA